MSVPAVPVAEYAPNAYLRPGQTRGATTEPHRADNELLPRLHLIYYNKCFNWILRSINDFIRNEVFLLVISQSKVSVLARYEAG